MDESSVAHGLSGDGAHTPAPRQPDPLFPGYPFDLRLVAGLTPIAEGGALDFTIDRPQGMKGWVIHLTVRGRGQVFDEPEGWTCERGELALFAPGTRHFYRRAAGSDCWFHRWVYFQPRGFWSPWLHWPDTCRGVGRLRLHDEALLDEFERLFVEVDALHRSTHRMAQDLATNQLERLLLRAQEEAVDDAQDGTAPDARVQAACRWITQHLAEDLSLDEVAREVHLSPSRLAQLFREHTGLSLLRWREDQRLQVARHLLQTTGTPVSHISASVGYDDQLYFSRVFRKSMGVSPTEFRRRG
jgi:AraC family transcriptional regulator, arabinose operon regulatory protein